MQHSCDDVTVSGVLLQQSGNDIFNQSLYVEHRPFIHLYIKSRNKFWATHVQSLKLTVSVVQPVKYS